MDYGEAGSLATTGLTSATALYATTGSIMLAAGIVLVAVAAIAVRVGFRRKKQAIDPS